MTDLYKISGKVVKTDDTTLTANSSGNLETIRASDVEAIAGSDTNKALTPASGMALVVDQINQHLTNALIYRGSWAITTSTTDYSGLNSYRPIKAGDYFRVTGTGPATIDGVEYNPNDSIIFNQACSATTTITTAMIDHQDHTDASDTVYETATQTLTNKTIDADDNTISDLETDNFKSGVVITNIGPSSGSGAATDTEIPTALAVRSAINAATPTVDGETVSYNSDNELQAIGVIEKNSGNAIYDWVGTLAEYNTAKTAGLIPNDWVCHITDDSFSYDSSKIVMTDSAQTITGNKTFTGDVVVPTTTDDVGTSLDAVNVKYLYDNGYADVRSGKANTDLDNLTATGESHFANPALSNSPYTTNRILEIPQDIKLELNNGKLTLKAGSKVYIPNGFEQDGTTLKFDTYTFTNDIPQTNSHNNIDLLFVIPNKTSMFALPAQANCFSGPTVPSGSYTYAFWYDTATNLIKNTSNGGTTWTPGYSLPVCIATGNSSSTFASINQIFNGFGYIGSTVFLLPGVKVQAPNGKNTDGTYKNVIYTTSSALIHTPTATNTVLTEFLYSADGLGGNEASSVSYNSDKNMMYSGSTAFRGTALLDITMDANGKIENFKPKMVDSVANSNASNFSQAGRSYLSGLGMPSTKYDNLTILASGQFYTAPANGYFVYNTAVGGASYVLMSNMTCKIYTADIGGISGTGKSTMRCFVPCYAGDSMTLIYSLSSGSSTTLYFVYAKGEI